MSTNLGARGVYVEWTSAGTVYRHNPAPRSAPPSWPSATVGYSPIDASRVAELIDDSAATRRRSGVFGALTGIGTTLAAAFALGDPLAALLTGGVAGVVATAVARRRRFSLLYDAEDRGQQIFLQRLDAAFASLRATTSMVAVRGNAAATSPPTHLAIGRPEEAALPFDTNVDAPCWRLGDVRVAFLPDRVAVVHDDQTAFAEYSAVTLNHDATDVAEELTVPHDALVVASTWRHTTRTGAPDRRYRNNPAVHIVRYGLLHLHLGQSLSLTVQTLRFDAAAAAWAAIRDVLRDHPSCRASSLSIPPPAVPRSPSPSVPPLEPPPMASPSPPRASTPAAPASPMWIQPPEPPATGALRPSAAPPPMLARSVEAPLQRATPPPPPMPSAAMRSLAPTAAMPVMTPMPSAPARPPATPMPAMVRTAAMPAVEWAVDPETQEPPVSAVVAVASSAPPPRDAPVPPVTSTPSSSPAPVQSPPPAPPSTDAIDDAPPLVAAAVAPPTFAVPRAPAAAKPASEVARWVLSGERIDIQGHVIDGGLVYVGDYFAERGGRDEPSLIRPSWPVAPSRDASGGDLGYWPSYGQITPAQRGTYLAWLAGGRRDPTVAIGYVFIFFYGLERRVFLDPDRTSDDLRAIRHEIRALRQVYGSNASFERYSTALLDAIAMLGGTFRTETPPAVDAGGEELPLWLCFGLAERAHAKAPIDAPWAIAWHDAARGRTSRTVRSRCEEEVCALFAAYYRERFGDGLVPARGRARLAATYRAASLAFDREVSLPVGELTDPTRGPSAKTALDKIGPILQRCVEELDGYSRWLGRNPEGRGSAAALAHLPPPLRSARGGAQTELARSLESKLADAPWAVIHGRDLIELLGVARGPRFGKPEAMTAIQLLEALGLGVEPDLRFRGPALGYDGEVVLFRLPAGSPSAPSRAYEAATLFAQLAAVMASADRSIGDDERRHAEEHIERALELSPAERARIAAHLTWLLRAPPSAAAVKKRLAAVPASGREALASFLVGVAGADCHIDPAEIKLLQKLYPLLGFGADLVFKYIHAMSADAGVSRGSLPSPRPSAPPRASGVDLDMNRVQATLAQTASVSSLLGSIFADEPEPAQASPAASPSVAGLDDAHAALFAALTEKAAWTRGEFEALCARWSLMPDGALEVLNERAFDLAGAPLSEGDDPIAVDAAIAKEMRDA